MYLGVVLVAVSITPAAQAHTNPLVDALVYTDSGGGTALTDEAMDELRAKVGSGNYTIEGPTEASNDVLEDSRRRSRLLPALRLLGTLGVAAAAVDTTVGWRFCLEASCPGSNWLYRKITGEGYGGSLTSITPYWFYETGSNTSMTGFFGGGFFPEGWYLSRNTGFTTYIYCNPSAACTSPQSTFSDLALDRLATVGTATQHSASGGKNGGCSAGAQTSCYVLGRTDAQMSGRVQTHTISQAQYDALTTKVSSGGYVPPATPTTADKEAAATALGGEGPNTSAQEAAEEALAEELDPSFDTITLLQPQPNETYSAYVARLEAAGWLGTATSTELAATNEGYGPEAVVRLSYAVGASTTTLDPLRWPTAGVQFDANTNITIRYNPDTALEAPTDGPGTGGGDPGGGLDFSPLTPDEACDKFPFGVVCWVAEQVEIMFLQEPRGPHVSMTTPEMTPLDGFTIPEFSFGWDFDDTEVFDGYIELVRAVLGFLLWLYGLWFLGTRLLGIKGAADTQSDGLD